MDKIALVVALATAAWVLLFAPAASDPSPDGWDQAEARLADMETRIAALEADEQDSGPMLEGTPGVRPDLASVLARLEALEAAKAEGKSTAGGTAPTEAAAAARALRAQMLDRRLTSTRQASRRMELSDRQTVDFERIINGAAERLRELYQTPNEDGKLLRDVGSMELGSSREGAGGLMEKMRGARDRERRFKSGLVPGTRETYQEAESRIRRESEAEVRRLLTPEQVKIWDEADVGGLLGVPRDVRGGIRFGRGTSKED